MNKDVFIVVMAGGVGSRFWPLSKTNRPKQFLDILGTGKTLLQQTISRFETICPPSNIYIVTNSLYKEVIAEQVPQIPASQVLLEPSKRNTAPCIAYANHKIRKQNPNARVVVAPSDHLILNETEFIRVINSGLEFVKENNALLTLGITPSRPETGYGYIQIDTDEGKTGNEIKKVRTFTEKPNYEMAKIFYESREFFWNAGIFIWDLKTIENAFSLFLPEVNDLFLEGTNFYDTEQEISFIERVYSECKNISIDYGIMEKADNRYVLCSDFGWSDLGTWGSLYENSQKDSNGNVCNTENAFTYQTKNCIVNLPKQKLVVIQGLENYIIVESDDILLICNRLEEQQIRHFVSDVKIKKGDFYV